MWPTKGPRWSQDHPGPEPRAPRRNRPRVLRSEAAGWAGAGRAVAPRPRSGRLRWGGRAAEAPAQARRALTSPRGRAWAAAALRLAAAEAGAGSGEGGPRRTAARPGTEPTTPPQRRRRHRRPRFQDGRPGRGHLATASASASGARLAAAAALGGRAGVAGVSLPPPAPQGGDARRVRAGGSPRPWAPTPPAGVVGAPPPSRRFSAISLSSGRPPGSRTPTLSRTLSSTGPRTSGRKGVRRSREDSPS